MIAPLGGDPVSGTGAVPSSVRASDALPAVVGTLFGGVSFGRVFSEKVHNEYRKSTDSAPMGALTV